VEIEGQIDSGAIERLERKVDLLLRTYQAELAKNPTSRAAESSRSNMIALRHTIEQIGGKRAAELRHPQNVEPPGALLRAHGVDENASVTASPL